MDGANLAQNKVVFYVFSGVHQGARLELPLGRFLIGASDDCDLILTGLAANHATISIELAEDGAEPQVTIEPMDGQVTFAGNVIQEKTTLPSGAPWYLDKTCLVWNLPGILQTQPVLNEEISPSEPKQPEENEEKPEEPEPPRVIQKAEPIPPVAEEEKPVELPEPPKRQAFYKRISKTWSLLILAILLGVLSFSISPKNPSSSEYPAMVDMLLAKEKIQGLLVRNRDKGVEICGAVATSQTLERLSSAVEALPFPVYLEVAVDADIQNAVRNSLGVRGFYPLVTMKRGTGVPKLVISAYMRDALIEADAFNYLEHDVPSPPVKERKIVYEQDVAPYLTNALNTAGFSDLMAVYLPGRVSLQGDVGTRGPELARLKAALSAHFGVPLFAEAGVDKSITMPKSPAALAITPKKPVATKITTQPDLQELLGGVKITGVFVAPLAFISTESGERLFTGTVLPSGAVIENITPSKLTVRVGNEVRTYPLMR